MATVTSAEHAHQLRESAAEYRKEAAKLEREAARLEKAARLLEGANGVSLGRTQREQLTHLLERRGPLTRSDIKMAGVSEAILKTWLRERYFIKDNEGRWSVKSD
jgi:hypothetical protein